MIHYAVRIRRLVWGDHSSRMVGEARSRDDHLEMVRRDLRERFGDDGSRLWVYSYTVVEIDEETDACSLIHEKVAYGSRKSVEKAVNEIWDYWVGLSSH